MFEFNTITLIILLPLLGFALLSLFGRKYIKRFSGIAGTLLMFATTAIALYAAWDYFFVAGSVNGVYQAITPLHFSWLEFSPGMTIEMGLLLDPISAMMLVVVTVVSLMVHIFSLAYMKGEERFPTYFAHLSLFTFSMLGLVLSTNIFQIYIFWELVGVSSFLLIGCCL
jgi:NADH-quinone oxidoreductase subunit L